MDHQLDYRRKVQEKISKNSNDREGSSSRRDHKKKKRHRDDDR